MEKEIPQPGSCSFTAVLTVVLLVLWLQFFTVPEVEKDALLSQRQNVLGNASIEEIPDIEVEVNETTKVAVAAENVQEMHYVTRSDREGLFWISIDEDELNPAPRMTTQTLPPYWHWSPAARELGGELVVNASGVKPGRYNVTVEVWNHGEEHSHSGGDNTTFKVEVTGN